MTGWLWRFSGLGNGPERFHPPCCATEGIVNPMETIRAAWFLRTDRGNRLAVRHRGC